MPRHPIFLDLQDQPVVVIGGGDVAARKIGALLDARARVTVVSPRIVGSIRDWADAGRLHLEQRRYRAGDLRGARLAYAATGDRETNRAVRGEADRESVWLNVADDPDLCDFFAPAVVRRGSLTIAISTNGASPALAARLRKKLEADLGSEYGDVLDELAELRARCREQGRPLSEVRDEIERLIGRVLPRKSG
jgi:precorrin-2 dehydrogenase/sirohydrochlorin ferrochelatase